MCPSAPRVCSEPGGQKPVLSLSLDLINSLWVGSPRFCHQHTNAKSSKWQPYCPACRSKDGWIYLLMHVSVSPFACDQSGVATLPRPSECTTYLWSGRLPSGRLIACKRNWRCLCHYTHQSFKTKIQYIACILDRKQWLNHILSNL